MSVAHAVDETDETMPILARRDRTIMLRRPSFKTDVAAYHFGKHKKSCTFCQLKYNEDRACEVVGCFPISLFVGEKILNNLKSASHRAVMKKGVTLM